MYCICIIMWHSHLNDMEIPETKRLFPKGLNRVQHWVSRIGLYSGSSRKHGWRRGESTRLPPMWPGLESWRRRHTWVEFAVGSLTCSERFFSGYSGFLLSLKTNTSKFQFDLEHTDTFQPVLKCSVVKQITIYNYKWTSSRLKKGVRNWELAAYGNVKIQSLFGSWEKRGFLKVTVRRAVPLRECPLGKLPL